MDGIMFMWGYLDCIHLLDVFWNNNAGHAAFGFGNTHGTINQMADLHWATCQRNVFIRHVFEERDQIDLLLIITSDGRTCCLTNNRYHWLVIHFGIIESVQQVNGSWP